MAGRGYYYPADSAIDQNGNLHVVNRSPAADLRGVRITVSDVEGEFLYYYADYGQGDGEFISPSSITVDTQGRIYVSDDHTNSITVFDSSRRFLDKWGTHGAGRGEIDGPSGLVLDPEGNLYVVDQLNNRVQKFANDGRFLAAFGSEGGGNGQFNLPWGITVDARGDVYVADWRNDRIQKFSPDGEFLASFGEQGRGDGQFHRPDGVAVTENGYIFVADWGNERVQVLDPDGRFVQKLRGEATLSKWAEDFLKANTEEAEARSKSNLEKEIELFVDTPHEESSHIEKYFWGPASVTLDTQGRVYVTDTNRHRVQVYQQSD